jgi:hypothetical protein
MRVRETVPHFTFSLFARFVNRICLVSTGFFQVFMVFSRFWAFLPTSVAVDQHERRRNEPKAYQGLASMTPIYQRIFRKPI